MNEPTVICDQCHRYVPMSTALPFVLRGEWYHECAACIEKEAAKGKAYSAEELVVIAAQSGLEVSRG